MPLADKIMLRKRFVIETGLEILKSETELEHSRHRSVTNAMAHIRSCLVAYAFRPGKASISQAGEKIEAYPRTSTRTVWRRKGMLAHLLRIDDRRQHARFVMTGGCPFTHMGIPGVHVAWSLCRISMPRRRPQVLPAVEWSSTSYALHGWTGMNRV
ncbi:MAG: transposase [Rhodopila sp.]